MVYTNIASSYRVTTNSIIRNSTSSSSTKAEIARANKQTALEALDSTKNTLLFGIVGGLFITVLSGISFVRNEVGGTEGLSRSLSFYSLAIPSYIRYRYLMWKEDKASMEEWENLDKEISQKSLEKIKELEGFYIKTGQMAASNVGNAFPKIWVDTMSVLQDNCPSKPFPIIKSIIESEFKKPINEVFSYIDEKPIGAASIGQVHRATLKNGDKVVIKVMYPNVENIFRGDVRTIKMICQIAQPVYVPVLSEIENQFMTEFDYKLEAQQMNQVRQNLLKAGLVSENNDANDTSLFIIPKPNLDLCTKNVLVMEQFKGEKLAVGLKRDMERYAAQLGKTTEQYMEEEEKLNREARRKKIPRKGPTSEEFDRHIAVLDMARRTQNLMNKFNNIFVAWWMPGSNWKAYEDKSSLPTNYAKMVDKLFYVHGHEIMVDGYFNSDPHPGNLLLVRNENQSLQLGLIDYGQVKKISDKSRHLFCRLIIALDDDNKDEIVRLTKEAGYKTKKMNDDMIYKFAKVMYDQDNPEIMGGKRIQRYLQELENADPVIQLPVELVMISRVSVMLRSLGHHLQQSRSTAKLWRPIAEEVLRRET